MDRKRILLVAAALVLVGLFYLQYREWHSFAWATFWSQTQRIKKVHVLHGIALIYVGYLLRALRWQIFLKPIRPKTRVSELVSPTLIGFTGLALLGRAGEFIRPYLIARRTSLPLSSQLAVWTVERIFDIGAFAALLVLAVFREKGLRSIPHPEYYRPLTFFSFGLIAFVAVLSGIAIFAKRRGEKFAIWSEKRFSHLGLALSRRVGLRVREFGEGLNAIQGVWSLFLLSMVSVAMWYAIAVAYKEVTYSYGIPALEIPVWQVLLLMGSSMVGSMLQLPAVGGGSQLATIKTLVALFDAPQEAATSCGILLWLVTFAAVVPVGLLLAHHERLSLRKLSEESHQAEEVEMGSPPAA